jgi:23S rRNA (cytosine1962-C5)-methyltransferase
MTGLITLKKNEEHRIVDGHLWAFSNEIGSISGEPTTGDIVELRTHSGTTLGKGFFNSSSLIAVRLLTRCADEPIDFTFFQKRISSALALRKMLFPGSDVYRLIHGESDLLPGLIIDRYNDYLVVQTFSAGMDKRLTLICDVLDSLIHPKGIVERNESNLRTYEGLEQKKGILRGSSAPIILQENGIRYGVDPLEGQKTGFFLDQRENRFSIRRYSHGARVLDCFCNLGGFALNAAAAGAREVIGVDIAASSIAQATENAGLNKLNVRFVEKDVFDFMKDAVKEDEKFDCIILDPPSFAKNRKTVGQAKKGYRDLHEQALRMLKSGGILATASCSHHVFESTFLEIVGNALRKTGRQASLLEWRGASPDHPVLTGMPETRYLKFGIFRVD